MNQLIGEIVERLIYIKDNYDIKDRRDLEAINNACNILSYKFDRLTSVNMLLDKKCISSDKKQVLSDEEQMKEKIITTMKLMFQKDCVCNYIFVQNGKEIYYKNLLSTEAYMKAYNMSIDGNVECYMAPLGEKAVTPIFTVIDGIVTLSGLVINSKEE